MTLRPRNHHPRTIAGGAGDAARIEAVLPRPGFSRARTRQSLLEDERVLAFVLLTPTLVLLGLFIAYPFVMGVWLSVSDTSVGNPGHFVGLKNFVKAWNDSIFRQAVGNTFVYTF